MDLEYWIDYIHLFGISHKIPKYDHLGVIAFYNLDVLAVFAIVFYMLYKFVKVVLVKGYGLIFKKKEKVENSERARKKGNKDKQKNE